MNNLVSTIILDKIEDLNIKNDFFLKPADIDLNNSLYYSIHNLDNRLCGIVFNPYDGISSDMNQEEKDEIIIKNMADTLSSVILAFS